MEEENQTKNVDQMNTSADQTTKNVAAADQTNKNAAAASTITRFFRQWSTRLYEDQERKWLRNYSQRFYIASNVCYNKYDLVRYFVRMSCVDLNIETTTPRCPKTGQIIPVSVLMVLIYRTTKLKDRQYVVNDCLYKCLNRVYKHDFLVTSTENIIKIINVTKLQHRMGSILMFRLGIEAIQTLKRHHLQLRKFLETTLHTMSTQTNIFQEFQQLILKK